MLVELGLSCSRRCVSLLAMHEEVMLMLLETYMERFNVISL